MTVSQYFEKLPKRQFIDRDGFRWWLEEDRDHVARFVHNR